MSFFKKLSLIDNELRKVIETGEYSSDIDFLLPHIQAINGSKKYLTQQYIMANFMLNNNRSSILIQNFIQQYIKRPTFKNMIFFKTNSNDSPESFRINLQTTPFEIIAAEYEEPFSSYLLELSLNKEEAFFDNQLGFYVNYRINKNTATWLTFEKATTPFVIKNHEVIILKKNSTLEKTLLQSIPSTSTVIETQLIMITGDVSDPSPELLTSLKEKLNLDYSMDQIIDAFNNNKIAIKDQMLEKSYNKFITTLNDDGKKSSSITRIGIDFFFEIDKKKQFDFWNYIMRRSIELIKISIDDCVAAFNSLDIEVDRESTEHIFEPFNDTVNMNLTLMKKNEIESEKKCLKIHPAYNNLVAFICEYNDIEFGADILIVDKNKVISTDLCFKKLDEFYKIFLESLNKLFNIDIPKLLI